MPISKVNKKKTLNQSCQEPMSVRPPIYIYDNASIKF